MSVKNQQILVFNSENERKDLNLDFLDAELSILEFSTVSKMIEHLEDESGVVQFLIVIFVYNPESDIENAVKKLTETDIPVIGVGPFIDDSHKTAFFESGIDDYIAIPLNKTEFQSKIKKTIERRKHLFAQSEEVTQAFSTALTAINDASELANLIHFLQESFESQSIEQLADLILKSSEDFGLSSAVQIRTPADSLNRSTSGEASERDIEVLTSLQNIGRIFQFKNRLILNFGPISQLIKNLPEDDTDKCGRLRDHLAIILEGALTRLNSLFLLTEMKKILEETNLTIVNIKKQQSQLKAENVAIMENMLEEVQAGLSTYGLTLEQEQILLDVVERYATQIFGSYDESATLDTEIEKIAEKINGTIGFLIPRNETKYKINNPESGLYLQGENH